MPEGMGEVMNEFPKTFQDWVTRHILGFNGCNRNLSQYKERISKVCPSYRHPNKDAKHILRCTDQQCTTLTTKMSNFGLAWLGSG
jgi:hypothetical protein